MEDEKWSEHDRVISGIAACLISVVAVIGLFIFFLLIFVRFT